jgi:hypothetical protein
MSEISVLQGTWTYFVAFGMWSEGNVPKNGNTAFGFSFTTCCSTPASFGQSLLGKKHCDDTGTFPILS